MSIVNLDVIKISIVIPVYSGAAYLEELTEEIDKLRNRLVQAVPIVELTEAIFVLDAPIDSSRTLLLARRDSLPWLRIVELSRNFGQHGATVAGILHSSGDWVVTIDEDLQHPPNVIPRLLALIAEHSDDVLYTTPATGTHQGLFRDTSSRLAKRGVVWLTGNHHVKEFASFRLIRGQIARAAASVCSDQTYFDMALLWFTTKVKAHSMLLEDRRSRQDGGSGYSLSKLLTHAKRLVFSSDVHFFRLALAFSGLALILSVSLLVWVLVGYWLFPEKFDANGWASLMSVNLFFGGTLTVLLGLLLEFVRTGVFHGQGKPTFFVVDRSGDELLRKSANRLLELSDFESSSSF